MCWTACGPSRRNRAVNGPSRVRTRKKLAHNLSPLFSLQFSTGTTPKQQHHVALDLNMYLARQVHGNYAN